MHRREQSDKAELLDRQIPLAGASHAKVIRYGVDVPMRYSECFAILTDGRKVRLKDSRQFMGFSGHDRNCSLLFRSGGRRIVIDADACRQTSRHNDIRRFIARDGSLLFVRRWGQEFARSVGDRVQTFTIPVREPELLAANVSL